MIDCNIERLENRLADISPIVVKQAVDGYIDTIAKRIFSSGYDLSLLLERTEQENTQLFNDTWEQVRAKLLDPIVYLRKKHGFENNEEGNKKLQALINLKHASLNNQLKLAEEKTAFINEVKKKFNEYGVGVSYKINDEEIAKENNERETQGNRDGVHINPLTIDPKTIANTLVKLIAGTIPKYEYSETGQIKEKQSELFMPTFYDFDTINRFLQANAIGVTNIHELFQKIESKFKEPATERYNEKYLWIPELIKRLNLDKEILTRPQINTIVSFEAAYANKQIAEVVKQILGRASYSVDPAQTENTKRSAEIWRNNVIQNINLPESDDNLIQDRFFIQTNTGLHINREGKEYKDFINSAKVTRDESESNLTNLLKKLGYLGINFNASIPEIINNKTQLKIAPEKNSGILFDAYLAIVKVLNSKYGEKGSYITNSFDELFFESVTSKINNLAKVYGNLNPSDQTFSHYTPEGEIMFAMSNMNGTGAQVRKIDQAKTFEELIESRPELRNNPYVNFSRNITHDMLFNESGERYSDAYYRQAVVLGIGIGETDEGSSSSKLEANDRALQDINNILKNITTFGINADKNTEWAQSLWKPYFQFQYTSATNKGTNPKILQHWTNLLMDEIDAAWAEIYTPGHVVHYQDNVWKLAYFSGILPKELIKTFQEDVLLFKDGKRPAKENRGTNEEYYTRRAKFLADYDSEIKDSITKHINKVSEEYINVLLQSGAFKKIGKDNPHYVPSGIMRKDLETLLGKTDLSKLTLDQIRNISRFIQINYEVARNEQHKFHFGHPSYYADVMKRYALWMGVKQVLSSNPVVLANINRLRRTDLRVDTISETNLDRYRRHVTYKELVYVLEGHEEMAERFYEANKGKYSKERLEKHLGVIFTEDGKFKELLLTDKGKPQGAIGKYCAVKGADSKCNLSFDYYWAYKMRLRGLTKDEQRLYDFDWAYEIYTLGTATKESGKHFDYPEEWIKEAQATLDSFSWTRPNIPVQITKPSYAGFSKTGVPVTLKDSERYTCLWLVEGTADEDAYIAHKRLGIDSYGLESGQKSGALTEDDGTFVSYYDDSGKYGGRTPKIQFLNPEGIGEQVQSGVHDDVVGSQMNKQIASDLPEHLKPVQFELNQAMGDLITLKTTNLLKDAGITNVGDGVYSVGDATQFSNKLSTALLKSGISPNQIEALQVTNLGDGKFHITTPFDALPIKDPIEYMIWSMINKEIVNPRYFGAPAVQIPMHGLESFNEPVRFAYLNKDLKKYEYLTKEQVKERNLSQQDLQIVQSKDTAQRIENGKTTPYKNVIPWVLGKIKVEDEAGKERDLHPKDIGLVLHPGGIWKDVDLQGNKLNILDPRMLQTLGFRIPTPGVTGISAGEAMGFFDPSMGSVMAKYSSEVAKQDDDFDYDKFNLMYVPVRKKKKDFKSKAFQEHMLTHLKALGYSNAEEVLGSYTENDFKLINESAKTEVGQSFHNTKTHLRELAGGDAAFERNLLHIKSGIQSWNAKFKKVVLEVVDPEEKTEEGYMSKIWHKRWELMTDGERYASMMNPISMGTIPEDAKDIRKLLGESNEEVKMTKNMELSYSEKMRQEFVSSKSNLAPVAKAVAAHSMLQQAGIYLTGHFNANKIYYFWHPSRSAQKKDPNKLSAYPITMIFPHNVNAEGKMYFGGIEDAEGNVISQNYSSRLQAILEVVKNSAIKDVGIKSRTVGTADYLTELGVPDKFIHYFFTQPIIKKFIEEMDNDSSLYNSIKGKRIWKSGVVYKLLRQYSGRSWNKDSFLDFKDKKDFYDRLLPQLEQLQTVTIEQLEKGLTDKSKESNLFQMQILFRFLQYEAQAGAMFTYSQYIGDDTNNIKTFDEYQYNLRKLDQVYDDGLIANPEDINEHTFLGKLKNSLSEVNNALKQYFVSMEERLQPLIENYIDTLETSFIKEDVRKEAINRYRRFIANYLIQTLPGVDDKILGTSARELLIGENSIGKQLARLKKKYPDNLLLNQLQPLLTTIEGQADSLKPLGLKNTPLEIEQIVQTAMQGWKTKKIKDRELKMFISNLAKFSLIQTGGIPSRNAINKFLPSALYLQTSKAPLEWFKNNKYANINPDLLDKNFVQIFYETDPRVPKLENEFIDKENSDNDTEADYLTYTNALTTNDNTLSPYFVLVPTYNSKSQSEYVWRYEPVLGLSLSQQSINIRADKPELNGAKYLYQRIPGAIKVGVRRVGTGEIDPRTGHELKKNLDVKCQVFKRINTFGKKGTSVEVNLTGFSESIHPQNNPFNELQPKIQAEIRALIEPPEEKNIWKDGNNPVPLQGPSPENPSSILGDSENNEDLDQEMGGTKTEGDPMKPDLSIHTNHTGGALGADTDWDEIGSEYGMVNNNHYYYGPKTPKGNVLISKEEFEEGKQHVLLANKTLNRKPEKYMNLLARNWIQVKNSDAVYAVSTLQSNKLVSGGTGWAVQMAIDAKKPVFVFDQKLNQWFTYDYDKSLFIKTEVPVLTRNFAGIGTREINSNGKRAIKNVYEKTLGITPSSGKALENTRKPGEVGSIENPHKMMMNFADGTGGREMRPEFRGKSTLELIKTGDRTATSRDRTKSYNQQDIKVGDYIIFSNDKGDKVTVQATTEPYPVQRVDAETWSKLEGWTTKLYHDLVKKGYDQFQFKLLDSNIKMDIIPVTTNFSRQSVINDPTHIYLFTDNAKRSSGSNKIEANTTYAKRYGQNSYPTITQAVIRGLENAYPITTMVDDNKTQWTDNKFDEYKKIIDSEIEHIKEAMSSGNYVGIKFAAQMPFGKGRISNMKASAPKIWNYMTNKLKEIGIDNTGASPKVNISEPTPIPGKAQLSLFDTITPDNVDAAIRNATETGEVKDLCNKK